MFNKNSLKTACAAAAFSLAVGSPATSEDHIDILEKNCAICHNNHTLEQLTTNYPFKVNLKDRITRSKGDPKLMPGTGIPLDSQSIEILGNWIDSEFNKSSEPLIQNELSLEKLNLIENHWKSLHHRDQQFAVYFTMDQYDEEYEDALRKLINSLSWNDDLIFPQPLDHSRTILYVHSRRLFWNENVLRDIRQAYPPSRNYPQLIIPIDWFVVNASDSRSLYHAILYDPRDIFNEIGLVRNKLYPPEYSTRLGGVTFKVASNAIQRSSDPGFTLYELQLFNSGGVYGKEDNGIEKWTSGVSFKNRILDRLESIYGTYWKSYDFDDTKEYNDIFNNTADNLLHFGNEMIFSLPNGLHAYFITNLRGARLDVAPYAIVQHPYDPNIVINPNKPKWIPDPNGDGNILDPENNGNIINGISCMKCHSNGIIKFRDETGDHLKTSNQPDLTGLIEKDNSRYRNQLRYLSVGFKSDNMDSVISIYDKFSKDKGVVAAAPPVPKKPQKTVLGQNYPNPFNPETWIPYELVDPAEVTISIYTIKGDLVRVMDLGYQAAGRYKNRSRAAYWDGRNQVGERVSTGVYYYALTPGDINRIGKMVVMK